MYLATNLLIYTPIRAGAKRQTHVGGKEAQLHHGLFEITNDEISMDGNGNYILKFHGKQAGKKRPYLTYIVPNEIRYVGEALYRIAKSKPSGAGDKPLFSLAVNGKEVNGKTVGAGLVSLGYDSGIKTLRDEILSNNSYVRSTGLNMKDPDLKITPHDLRRMQATAQFFDILNKKVNSKSTWNKDTVKREKQFLGIVHDSCVELSEFLQQENPSNTRSYIMPALFNHSPWKSIYQKAMGKPLGKVEIKITDKGISTISAPTVGAKWTPDTGLQALHRELWSSSKKRKDGKTKEKSLDMDNQMQVAGFGAFVGALIDFEPTVVVDDEAYDFMQKLTEAVESALPDNGKEEELEE
jgi:hypothetical protein